MTRSNMPNAGQRILEWAIKTGRFGGSNLVQIVADGPEQAQALKDQLCGGENTDEIRTRQSHKQGNEWVVEISPVLVAEKGWRPSNLADRPSDSVAPIVRLMSARKQIACLFNRDSMLRVPGYDGGNGGIAFIGTDAEIIRLRQLLDPLVPGIMMARAAGGLKLTIPTVSMAAFAPLMPENIRPEHLPVEATQDTASIRRGYEASMAQRDSGIRARG